VSFSLNNWTHNKKVIIHLTVPYRTSFRLVSR